ncbi:hypothetical protein ABZ468_15560 [Streptomyces sp. NPDC005708]|uniref:hypothetical protein n=1 Tax=unclassified Streptomyces TaxID=2593676 RepID=UPI0033FDBAB5
MNVMLRATRGRQLTAPVRRPDEMPGRPERPGTDDLDVSRLGGCRAAGPDHGVTGVCSCGAEAAVVASGCSGGHETRLVPDAVRVHAVQDVEATG